jgi:hypothetical protein
LFCLCLFFNAIFITSKSQDSSETRLIGFVDGFYRVNSPSSGVGGRQSFLFNHNRERVPTINLLVLGIEHQSPRLRAALKVQAGSYVNDNYSDEPAAFRPIHEARIGLALNKKKNLWLDAGLFASHIGFESAISADNATLSRSLLAENSPYYETGLRLQFAPTTTMEGSILLLTGWQSILPIEGSSLPAIGTQFLYKKEGWLLNWSSFTGTLYPDSARRLRFFQNFYAQKSWQERVYFTFGFDFGAEQNQKGSSTYHWWYSPVFLVRYQANKRWYYGLRGEWYLDRQDAVIASPSGVGFSALGWSLNADYQAANNLLLRAELRQLRSNGADFSTVSGFTTNQLSLLASVSWKWNRKI